MAANPDPIARALVKHMEQHSLTATEVAARAQISRSNFNDYLNGHRSMTVRNLVKVLDAIRRLEAVKREISR